jgi:hypothetical protein
MGRFGHRLRDLKAKHARAIAARYDRTKPIDQPRVANSHTKFIPLGPRNLFVL